MKNKINNNSSRKTISDLPSDIATAIEQSNVIYVSVFPIFEFPDTLLKMVRLLADIGIDVDVISTTKANQNLSCESEKKIVVCGDADLANIPSFILANSDVCGLDDFKEDISSPPWMALRIFFDSEGGVVFEYLTSSHGESCEVDFFSSENKDNLLNLSIMVGAMGNKIDSGSEGGDEPTYFVE